LADPSSANESNAPASIDVEISQHELRAIRAVETGHK
jgi:hypothetical protein